MTFVEICYLINGPPYKDHPLDILMLAKLFPELENTRWYPGLLLCFFTMGLIYSIFQFIAIRQKRIEMYKRCLWFISIVGIGVLTLNIVQLFYIPKLAALSLLIDVVQVYYWMSIQSYYQELVTEKGLLRSP